MCLLIKKSQCDKGGLKLALFFKISAMLLYFFGPQLLRENWIKSVFKHASSYDVLLRCNYSLYFALVLRTITVLENPSKCNKLLIDV